VKAIRVTALAAIGVMAVLGLAACGDDNDNSGSSDEPSVTFTSPMDGATESGTVTASVDLTNFELDAADVGKENVDGRGHLHFSLDDGKFDHPKYSGANGQLAVQLGVDGQYSPSTEPGITYKGVPPGKHTLSVDLVNNDHSETGVSQSVTFTVE
jgi:hypothetical protein